MSENQPKDLVIVGAGPAGLSAAIYATRANLDFVCLEQSNVGGQVIVTSDIHNYPGVPKTTGFDLIDAMQRQATDLGADIQMDDVTSVEKDQATGLFTVHGSSADYVAKTVIVASGATPRHAGFAGEEDYAGRGVSYCATCDGMFYRGKQVFVVGGGNSAGEEALFLTRFADHVTMVVRKDHLRAQAAVISELEANPKVEIRYLTSITEVGGGDLLSSITFRNNETGETTTETFDEGSFGVFVFVGHNPAISMLGDLVELGDGNAVVANEDMSTKTEGLFVAGDVRLKPLRQIVTAASDGAIAATSVSAYLGHPVNS